LKHKFFYFLSKKQEEALQKWLLSKKDNRDVGSWVIDFIKQCIFNGYDNKKMFIESKKIKESDIDRMKVVSNPKFKIVGASKKVIIFSTNAMMNAFDDLFKLDNALNKNDKKKLHPSKEAYFHLLLSAEIEKYESEQFKMSIENEAKKAKSLSK